MRRTLCVALLLLTACGGDGDATDDATPSSTATTTPSTTAATAPDPPPTTSTAPTGPACPGEPLGAGVEAEPTRAQLDGDGQSDVVTTYQLGPANWRLRVDFADGGSSEEELETAPTDEAGVLAARDLDGDGTEELFVQVGTGAAAIVVGLFAVDACDIAPILHDGFPATFAVGGTVLLLQGLACGESDLTHLGATSEDGVTYATLDLTYELQGGELVRVGDESDVKPADDPDLAAYSDLAC